MPQFLAKRNGGAQPNISQEIIRNTKIALPPLEDQRRIATILDQAEALRAKRRQALAKLDTLTQSLFIEMFGDSLSNPKGWESRSLEDVADQITDGEHLNPPFSESGMPIIMAGNVLEDRVELSAAKKVSQTLGERFRRKCGPENGDLLLVSRGATIGRLCSITTENQFCLMGSVILIKPRRAIVRTEYLSAFLKQPGSRVSLYQTSGSSAQQAIYLKDLKRMRCYVPPMLLQKDFEEKMQDAFAVAKFNRVAREMNESLFKSLQACAFRGEL
jgi:type I restriction enzyme S subunit